MQGFTWRGDSDARKNGKYVSIWKQFGIKFHLKLQRKVEFYGWNNWEILFRYGLISSIFVMLSFNTEHGIFVKFEQWAI